MNSRAASSDGGTPGIQPGGGGSIPTAALFRKHEWRVDSISLHRCRELVRMFHYSKGGSNTRVYCHGLYPSECFFESQCVGVAWWIPPTKSAALSISDEWKGVLALSRLVVEPNVPKNAASFLISHSMRLIDRNRWPVLVTYADEWQGHTGAIYLAAGWKQDGKTKPEKRYTLNGRMVSRKRGPKTMTHSEMMAIGCRYEGDFSCVRFIHRIKTRGGA